MCAVSYQIDRYCDINDNDEKCNSCGEYICDICEGCICDDTCDCHDEDIENLNVNNL